MSSLRKYRIMAPNGRALTVQVTPWFSPYYQEGNRWRTALGNYTGASCGTYLIRSKATKEILYVGYSGSNLQKTLYRHFQSWDDPTQHRTTYKNRNAYQVMIVLPNNCDNAYMLEQYYINREQPRDGIRKLEIDPEDIAFSQMPSVKRQPVEDYEEVPF